MPAVSRDDSLSRETGGEGPAAQGNLLLDRPMGADVTVIDIESMEGTQPWLDEKAHELEAAGLT